MRGIVRYLVAIEMSVFASQVTGQTPLSISFVRHDFGQIAVTATSILQFTVGGVQVGDTVFAVIEGPDAGDWVLNASSSSFGRSRTFSPCDSRNRYNYGTCGGFVVFFPASVGTKQAVLRIVASGGRMASADLTGRAVAPLCTHTVVPCNYAHLYSGVLSWTHSVQGQAGSTRLGVTVTIDKGQALCNGSETVTSPDGTPWVGTIVGPGLLGVEFLADPMYPLVYQITVACPSPAYPDHADGSSGRPSAPAELGSSYSVVTDRQPARRAGEPLAAALNFPAPETDPDNGVTGMVGLSWNLTTTPTPTPPPPPPPPPAPAQRPAPGNQSP